MTSSFDTAVHHVTSALEAYVTELESLANPLSSSNIHHKYDSLSSSSTGTKDSHVSTSSVTYSCQFLEKAFTNLSPEILNNVDRTTIVELVMRTYLYNQLQRKDVDPQQSLEMLIDISIAAANQRWIPLVTSTTTTSITTENKDSRLIEPTIIFILFEDIFDALPISRLERFWTVVEERRTQFIPFLDTQKVRLALLRVTSGLLRRLSRTLDTVLCGRILLFLAFILPLSDRSGVNVTGQLNTDNITEYEGKNEDLSLIELAGNWKPNPNLSSTSTTTTTTITSTNKSSSTPTVDTTSNPTIDGRFHIEACARTISEAYKAAESGSGADNTAFYRAFWRLQYMLYHPSTVVASLESWNLFLGSMRVVLRAFEKDDEESGIARSLMGPPSARSIVPTASSTVTNIVSARSTDMEEGEEGETTTVITSTKTTTVATTTKSSSTTSGKSTTSISITLPPAIPSFSAVTVSAFDRDTGAAPLSATLISQKINTNTSTDESKSSTNRNALMVTSPSLMSGSMIGSTIRATHSTSSTNADFSGAKYLTSRALLALELKDPTLRRHVILQFLIGMQYCVLTRKGDKEKPPVGSNPEKDLAPLRDLCYILLRRTPPEGPFFVRAISSILSRELYWNTWKQTGAAAFERTAPPPAPTPSATDETMTDIGNDGLGGGSMKRKAGALGTKGNMGAKRLRMLTRRPLNWSSAGMDKPLLDVCAQSSRAVRPQFLAYILPMKVALDYRSGIDAEYSPASDHLYVWRGLRLFATDNLASFFDIGTGKSFADAVVQTLHIELPVKPEPPKPEIMEETKEETTISNENTEDGNGNEKVEDQEMNTGESTPQNDQEEGEEEIVNEEGEEGHHEEGDELREEGEDGEQIVEEQEENNEPTGNEEYEATTEEGNEEYVEEGIDENTNEENNGENDNENINDENAMQEEEGVIVEQEIIEEEVNVEEETNVNEEVSENAQPEEGENE